MLLYSGLLCHTVLFFSILPFLCIWEAPCSNLHWKQVIPF
jgi:hypothetical protein